MQSRNKAKRTLCCFDYHIRVFTIECFTAYNVNFPLKDLVL